MHVDLPGRLAAVLRLDPEAPAIEQDGRWHLWGDVTAVADGVDRHLADAGHGPDAAVAVVLRNRWSLASVVLGLLATRRCVVTVSPIQSADGLSADLRALAPRALVADEADWSGPALAGLDTLGLAVGDGSVEVVRTTTADPELQPGVAVSMLTSGTTGPPKRVAQTYAAFEASLASAQAYTTVADTGPRLAGGVTIVALPMSHMSGMWPVVQAVADGRRISLLERFDPLAWAALVRDHRPVSVGLPPAPMRMVLDADVPAEWLASLKAVRVGSAPLPLDLADAFHERYGIPALPIYGATEFTGSVAGLSLRDWRDVGAAKRGTVGRAQPGVELRVVDPSTGVATAPGEPGLLEVRSASMGAAWVRTTDLARLDEDGFLFVDGRADDAIIRGGFKVLPPDVEAVLGRHPAVAEVAVVGVPDERLGSVPAAAVVVAPGCETSIAELQRWCVQHLRPYQVPAELWLVDALPQTRSMKVDRAAVRALLG